ncbi:MAG: hypothetical protein RIQ53_4427 [Pseudomonadota bacterium]|jgi:signal transduction histidine kinase
MRMPPPPVAEEAVIDRARSDPRRLAALQATGLLDTPPEEGLDRLTRLASRLIGVPVVAITLLDAERDVYKSQHGFLEPLATLMQYSGRTFCQHTLLDDAPLVLDDTAGTAGYAEVPTVQTMGLRAYAGVPLCDAQGQHIGSFCALDFQPRHWRDIDIDLLRELAQTVMRELALRRALRQTQRAEEARRAFLTEMSHEIRTPIHAVLGSAHLLAQTALDETQRGHLQRLSTASEHLRGLVDRQLELARIESGQLELEQIELALRPLLDGALALVAQAAEAKGLRLTLDADAAVLPGRLRGDPTRLRQMLLNLLANAVKFTERGGVTLAVQAEQRLPAAAGMPPRVCLRCEVRDTGAGLRPEQLARLFQPFRQADASTARRHGGSGLGLSIVKRLAAIMGGRCGADSQPGQGSRFWFSVWLDVAEGVAAEAEAGAATSAPPATDAAPPADDDDRAWLLHQAAGTRVLVADDNPINREVLAALLGAAGLQAVVVDDGLQALVACGQGERLILMDMEMPGLDGVAAAAAVRARDGLIQVPIVAMTAHAAAAERERCRAAGMDDFLVKPVHPAHLYATLRRWLTAGRPRPG